MKSGQPLIDAAGRHRMAKAELRLARADLLDTLDENPIHPGLVPLFNAVYEVTWRSSEIRLAYTEIERLRASGPPQPNEWPDSPEYQRWRDELINWMNKERAAKDTAIIDPPDPEWTEAIREWRDAYPAWSNAIVAARREADSPCVVELMNGTETRPTETWTGRLKIDLDRLGHTLHWTGAPGPDGLGVIRYRVPLPEDFRTRAKAVGDRLVEIRAVPKDSRLPTPTPGATEKPDMRTGQWFDRATNSHLKPDALRKAFNRGKLKKSIKQGRQLLHDTEEVGRVWPDHAKKIREKAGNGRTSTDTGGQT